MESVAATRLTSCRTLRIPGLWATMASSLTAVASSCRRYRLSSSRRSLSAVTSACARCSSRSDRLRSSALANTWATVASRSLRSSDHCRSCRTAPKSSAPTTVPPTISGNDRFDLGPIFSSVARSTAASGGSSSRLENEKTWPWSNRPKAYGNTSLRDEPRNRGESLHDIVVRILEELAIRRPLDQIAAIDADELDEQSQRLDDLVVHACGRRVDEPRRDIGQQPLERSGISLRQRHGRAHSRSRLIGKLPDSHWDLKPPRPHHAIHQTGRKPFPTVLCG